MQKIERSEVMRLRNVKNAKEILESSSYYIKNPTFYKGSFSSLFSNENPIHLEIGTGKGQFLIEMALKNPDINFIGMEKYESVLVRAVQKLSLKEIPNLKFISSDAQDISNIFDHEIDTLYLNFSDPWPKVRHQKRRLTHSSFLKLYDNIFSFDKKIIQKTDNIQLFSFSLEQLSQNGYILERVSLDLHKEDIVNVMTEYEEKFTNDGYKINYLKARKR